MENVSEVLTKRFDSTASNECAKRVYLDSLIATQAGDVRRAGQ